MSTKTLHRALAATFVIALIVPAAFFAIPGRATAAGSGAGCLGGLLGGLLSSTASVPTADATTESTTLGSCINEVILIPLARAAIHAILQEMTASIVRTIDGKNSAGSPQFVTNIAATLRSAGDQVGLSFIAQFGKNSNSPFASSISNALRTQYLQGTSLAGFFSANQCTLSKYSPNINGFLAGDWSKGGASAWLALSTKPQNNPFTLYQAASGQLTSALASAQTNLRQSISQGGGFLSWCSSGSTDTSGGQVGKACSDFDNGSDCNGNLVCVAGANGKGTCQAPTAATSDDTASTCYNKDGTPGTIQTPGSVIHDYTQKAVVDSGFDQLISASDIDSALSSIVSALFQQVLTKASGLLGAAGSSGSSSGGSSGASSIADQLQNYTSQSTATQSVSDTAQTVLTRVTAYTAAWNTIQGSAQSALTALNSFISSCPSQASVAQTALSSEVQPVLQDAQTALSAAATTQVLAQKVQGESGNSADPSTQATTASDLATLAVSPPMANDLQGAQTNAKVTNQAATLKNQPFNVYGGTIVDRMNLLVQSTNSPASCPFFGPLLTP